MFFEVKFNVLRKKTKKSKLEFATEMIICGNESDDIKNAIVFIVQNTSEIKFTLSSLSVVKN